MLTFNQWVFRVAESKNPATIVENIIKLYEGADKGSASSYYDICRKAYEKFFNAEVSQQLEKVKKQFGINDSDAITYAESCPGESVTEIFEYVRSKYEPVMLGYLDWTFLETIVSISSEKCIYCLFLMIGIIVKYGCTDVDIKAEILYNLSRLLIERGVYPEFDINAQRLSEEEVKGIAKTGKVFYCGDADITMY